MSQNLDSNPTFRDWQECRTSIARFDEAILSIRKYGFVLITGLLTADGIIYSGMLTNGKLEIGTTVGIYLALMILIVGLFRFDRVYEIFLRAAVVHAESLEDKLNISVSKEISKFTKKCATDAWGISLYSSFCAANFVLALGSVLNFADLKKSFCMHWLYIIIILLILLAAGIVIIVLHIRTKKEINDQ